MKLHEEQKLKEEIYKLIPTNKDAQQMKIKFIDNKMTKSMVSVSEVIKMAKYYDKAIKNLIEVLFNIKRIKGQEKAISKAAPIMECECENIAISVIELMENEECHSEPLKHLISALIGWARTSREEKTNNWLNEAYIIDTIEDVIRKHENRDVEEWKPKEH